MANTTIPSELIADGSVVTAKIANDAVDADKLASNAVVTASIADDAVTLAKMAANSVDSDQYVDGSIDTIHIADGAITSAKLDTNIAVGGTLNVSGAFTSLGIDDNATSTAITIDSSEKVAIGSTVTNKLFNLADPAQGGETLKLHFEADSALDNWGIYAYDRTNSHYADMYFGQNAIAIKGSNSNVGIGTSSPSGKLDVSVVSNQRIRFDDFGSKSRISSRNDAAAILPLLIDASDLILNSGSGGNVGIAAVPSGEAAAAHVVRLGDRVCISEYDDGSNPEQFNLFHNSNSSEKYIETGTASVIQQRAGEMVFYNAASGTAGAAISWAERIRILSGGGITFNGDTAAANALDDYEEGTWTPTCSTATIASINLATYTKIGRVVHVFTYVVLAADGTSGVASLSGLPFSIPSNNYEPSAVQISTNSAGRPIVGRAEATTNRINLYWADQTQTGVPTSDIDDGHWMISQTYHVA